MLKIQIEGKKSFFSHYLLHLKAAEQLKISNWEKVKLFYANLMMDLNNDCSKFGSTWMLDFSSKNSIDNLSEEISPKVPKRKSSCDSFFFVNLLH